MNEHSETSKNTTPDPFSRMIDDPAVLAVLKELHANARRGWEGHHGHGKRGGDADGLGRWGGSQDPFDYIDVGFSITPEQGDQFYLLARYARAQNIVEFATSLGFSTLYFAAALRDIGGGTVHTAELVPAKAAQARENLTRAGLAEYVDFRIGDARDVLRDIPESVDLVLIDGWPSRENEGLSLDVLQLIEPRLRAGAIVLNDNHEPDYLAYVRDPANGYRSLSLPTASRAKPATELSILVSSALRDSANAAP